MKYLIIVIKFDDYTGTYSVEIRDIKETIETAEIFILNYKLRYNEMCIYYAKGKVNNQ